MDRSTILLLTLAGAGVLWLLSRTQRGAAVASDVLEEVAVTARRIFSWSPPAAAKPYLPAIAAAEQKNGLPPNLLARMAYQESRFRADIISGRTQSSAGAVGILQIVPKWHPDVNAFDPFASIDYAAKYVRSLFNRFGHWQLALAAYNWGQGNQSRDLRDGIVGNEWPKETQNYVREISRDVGLA